MYIPVITLTGIYISSLSWICYKGKVNNPNRYIHQLLYITGDSVACMINNLGGTSVLELNIIAKEAIELLGM
jgi:dihydroxyacetone kinase